MFAARLNRGFLASALVLFAAADRAWADLVIDQQNHPSGAGNQGFAITPLVFDSSGRPFSNQPMGETFVPTLGGIDFATLNLYDINNVAGTFVVDVRQGFDGAVLGTSASVSLPARFGIPTTIGTPVEFDFGSRIALTPNSTYSLNIRRVDSSSLFFLTYTTSDTYAAGTGILAGNALTLDAYFSEGIFSTPSAVPEPSSLALCGIAGFAGLARAWMRRVRAV